MFSSSLSTSLNVINIIDVNFMILFLMFLVIFTPFLILFLVLFLKNVVRMRQVIFYLNTFLILVIFFLLYTTSFYSSSAEEFLSSGKGAITSDEISLVLDECKELKYNSDLLNQLYYINQTESFMGFSLKLINFDFFCLTFGSLNFWFPGISLIFILLSLLLVNICLYVGITLKDRKVFYILFAVLQLLLVLVFTTTNILLFYVCFEAILIPMFFLIGIWGSRERRIRAAYLFLMYSVAGSFLFLVGIIYNIYLTGTVDLIEMQNYNYTSMQQVILYLSCFFAFAIKTPLVPFHLWLPEAHVEAPTVGSIILAGILLKLGSYGFLRFSVTLFPIATQIFNPFLYTICVLGVIYASVVAFFQYDIKKVIAYSSVAHMSVLTVSLFNYDKISLYAAFLTMLGHTLVSSGLFLCIGILYEKFLTRNIFYYGGLTAIMPVFSFCFFLLTIANIAFPGTINFLGELLIILSFFKQTTIGTYLLLVGIFANTVYVIYFLNRILFLNFKLGNVYNGVSNLSDVYYGSTKDVYYYYSLLILIIPVIFFGINPNSLAIGVESDLNNILSI